MKNISLVQSNIDADNYNISMFMDSDKPLKYHKYWRNLMPVGEKIINLPFMGSWEQLTYYKLREDIEDGVTQFNINKTYKAIVKFINWYTKMTMELKNDKR